MQNVRKIMPEIYWLGGNDRRLHLFENLYPIPRGVSYNSYLVTDEKTVLLDTVDRAVSPLFFENLAAALGGRKLDYLIISHMEPDHAATLDELVLRYPDVKIVLNAKMLKMVRQYFTFPIEERAMLVNESDTLATGAHEFHFVMAPMVHWPEVMVTYDAATKTLFSADAFGTFGALSGNIFADEVNFEGEWLADARRYYTNIVGKYGTQVQALLKKASGLDIACICPLHGPIWRKNISWFVEKYALWSSYTPEENAVVIAYASIYGNTENAAELLASMLDDAGIKNIRMYDVSVTDTSEVLAECFRASHLVFACPTYNAGIFSPMQALLTDLKEHNLQNRVVGLIENGTWAPTSGQLMSGVVTSMKNMTLLSPLPSLVSSVKDAQIASLQSLANALIASMPGLSADASATEALSATAVDNAAMFKFSYGLFALIARDGDKQNACIINTAIQITDKPKQIAIAVNKANYTHDIIKKTGVFNLSVLSEDAPFSLFTRFGFQSGRDADKFANFDAVAVSANGLNYVTSLGGANALISAKVTSTIDIGTHTLFIASVTEAAVLDSVPSITYAYYFAHTKPKPHADETPKKGFICKICGYVYEGDTLPPDFICPLCKHGAEDFEPLK